MNSTKLQEFEDLVHHIRQRHENLYNYIIKEITTSHIKHGCSTHYTGLTYFKDGLDIDLSLPRELVNPPPFSESMYPLNENGTQFSDFRPYNYLCNFEWHSFRESYDHILYKKAISRLIDTHSQTRFSNIWSNIAAILIYFSQHDIGDGLKQALFHIMSLWKTFPFMDTWDGFTDVQPTTSTMWPAILYGWMSVSFNLITDGLTEAEAVLCHYNHMDMARVAYQDTKLRLKGYYINWLKASCHNLKSALVPIFSPAKTIIGVKIRITREIIDPGEFEGKEAKAREHLPPNFYAFLRVARTRVRTPEDLIRLFSVCTAARDDRVYYGTLMELALAKAIKPKVVGTVVPAPLPTLTYEEDDSMIVEASYPKHSFMHFIQEFYELYYSSLSYTMDKRDANASFLSYLSAASAGKKVEIATSFDMSQIDMQLRKLIEKGSNKRVLQEALLVNKYNDLNSIILDLKLPTPIVVRKQIERRQRGIAGLSNNRLKLNHPIYEANKSFHSLNGAPSHGKQTGGATDIHTLLYFTTMDDMVISSADVTGMDTSIQLNVALNQSLGTIKILDGMRYDVGPFRTSNVYVKDAKGNVTSRTLNGAQKAVIYANKHFSQVTSIQSDLFGPLDNKEGTFPSGLLTTSNHHTQFLTLAVEAAILQYNKLTKLCVSVSSISILGDDISMIFYGSDEEIGNFMSFFSEKLAELGLDLEKDESRNFGTFLQQQVILGRYNGFDNRIAIFTREDYKTRKSVRESSSEHNALFDDVLSRVFNTTALVRFQRVHGYVTLSKHLMLVPNTHYDSIVQVLKKKMRIYEYHKVHETKDIRFLGIHIPYAYFQCFKGGEMPPDSYERADGTYTLEYSSYTPRGEYLRKLLYDISGGSVLDQKMLSLYGFDVADFLISHGILEMERVVRDAIIDPYVVNKLALNLESLENSTLRHQSRQANNVLRHLGVRLPAAAVYGYQLNERMRQVLQSVEQSDVEVRQIGNMLSQAIIDNFPSFKVRTSIGDKHHCFSFTPHPDFPLDVSDKAEYLKHIAISKNMRPYSDGWKLYAYLADHVSMEGDIATALAHSQGHFKNFKYSQDLFLESVKIANRFGLGSSAMDEMFTAVNAKPESQELWKKAIIYYQENRDYIYPYSNNPRRMFFIPTNPPSVESVLLSDQLPSNVNLRALRFRQAYAFVLAHPQVLVSHKLEFNLT